MPPLPPNVTKAGILRSKSGWNNSSLSRTRNHVRMLSTRMPHSSGNSGGGVPNPSIGVGTIREAMPRGATGTWRPISLSGSLSWSLVQTILGTGNDFFGSDVAINSNYAMVGESGFDNGTDQGKVYFYERSGNTFVEVTSFAGEADEDYFGNPISLSGSYVIIGANQDTGTASDVGKVYFYERSGGTWSAGTPASIAGQASYDQYANPAVSGNYAIVGAPGVSSNTGRVYFYERSGGTWSAATPATINGAASGDRFGVTAISGNYAIVGAPGVSSNTGRVYFYEQSGGTWSAATPATFDGEASGNFFGSGVAISGNYAIVGAIAFNSDTGKIYIYERSGGTWTLATTFDGENAGDQFGIAVSISGNYAIVGANAFNSSTGKVYIYERSGGTWTLMTTFDGETAGDQFGVAASISGNYAIIGATGFGGGNGKTYIYQLN